MIIHILVLFVSTEFDSSTRYDGTLGRMKFGVVFSIMFLKDFFSPVTGVKTRNNMVSVSHVNAA